MKKLPLAGALAALAGPALAHTGVGEASGFTHGLLHPILGPDHLLAMLAVGLWSGFVLPHRFWAGAATFLSAMTAGAGLSWAGVPLPGVEAMIVLLAAIMAFPSSFKAKLWGLGLGFLAVQSVNLLRIVSLFFLNQ